MSEMKKVWLILLVVLSVVFAGCADVPKTTIGELPAITTKNLKEQHDYPVLKLQGTAVIYSDGDLTKSVFIDDWGSDFFILESNRTYLHYEKYGGLADFYQWTLYIKRGD